MFASAVLFAQGGGDEAVVAAATAGFWFGAFLGLPTLLWWALLLVSGFIEAFFVTRNFAYKCYGWMTFMIVVTLTTLHLFGVWDVIQFVSHHGWGLLLMAVYFIGIGLAYAPIRGFVTALRNRPVFTEKLRQRKHEWLMQKRIETERAKKTFEPQDFETEWQQVKPDIWKEVTTVEKDRGRIFFWIMFWPLDLAWHLVFQWFARIEDVLNFSWKRLKGVAQGIKNYALKGADKDV